MIETSEIFKKNIQFSKYGRTGIIVLTKNKNISKILEKAGWNCYLKNETYRLNPPTLNLVDIVDVDKAWQYKNLRFNYVLYKYIEILNKKSELNQYCHKVIEGHRIFFKDFEFHLSEGPLLKYVVKIEGSDNRIHKLKKYLINNVLNDKEFIKLNDKYMRLFSKKINIEERNIENRNIKLIENYIKRYDTKSYESNNKFFKIDFTQIDFTQFDYIIFVLSGCFKIMKYFDINKYKNKIIFWKIHMDETKGKNDFGDLEKLKNKSVLVIDSIYSGKTMLYIKKILKSVTSKINILGIFPKSDNVANLCDYIMVFNKVVKKTEDGFNIEREIIRILGG